MLLSVLIIQVFLSYVNGHSSIFLTIMVTQTSNSYASGHFVKEINIKAYLAPLSDYVSRNSVIHDAMLLKSCSKIKIHDMFVRFYENLRHF